MKSLFAILLLLLLASASFAQTSSRVNLRIVTDEADALLSILEKRKANTPITDADWQRLFSSEGYVRLKKREQSMRRTFEDADFKTFVMSDALSERAPLLKQTLEKWKRADASRAAKLALAYLPANARIQAKIYPVIKPRENSFVFDLDKDPAIFLYLNPKVTTQKFENTLAHELHHIGFGTGCPASETSAAIKQLPENVRNVYYWVSAFGEGFAMLAAAGGPKIHPHAVSLPDERAEWDKNILKFNSDLKLVEQFFLEIISGKLNEQERNTKAASFYGVQGPWYTVGWQMAVTIESAFGRAKLIECMCDQRLLPTYNRAVKQTPNSKLSLWSDDLLSAL